MRTDHHYEPLEPTEEQAAALLAWPGNLTAFDLTAVAETRDAPPLVLEWIDARLEHRREWELGAKDRAFTVEPQVSAYGRVRLFDGDWFDARAVPGAVEANFEVEANGLVEPSDAKVYMRYVAVPWEALEELAQAGDEQGCRRIAAAIYEYLELRGRAARTLVGTVNAEQKRHRSALVVQQTLEAMNAGKIKL